MSSPDCFLTHCGSTLARSLLQSVSFSSVVFSTHAPGNSCLPRLSDPSCLAQFPVSPDPPDLHERLQLPTGYCHSPTDILDSVLPSTQYSLLIKPVKSSCRLCVRLCVLIGNWYQTVTQCWCKQTQWYHQGWDALCLIQAKPPMHVRQALSDRISPCCRAAQTFGEM